MKSKILILGIIIGLALAVLISYNFSSQKESKFSGVSVNFYYGEGCGCCKEYLSYLKRKGFKVNAEVLTEEELIKLKQDLGISYELSSCHTALIDNYLVEGHMPVEAIEKLLNEKPEIKGISLPGMPPGSPGMTGFKTGPFKIHSLTKDGQYGGIFMEI